MGVVVLAILPGHDDAVSFLAIFFTGNLAGQHPLLRRDCGAGGVYAADGRSGRRARRVDAGPAALDGHIGWVDLPWSYGPVGTLGGGFGAAGSAAGVCDDRADI